MKEYRDMSVTRRSVLGAVAMAPAFLRAGKPAGIRIREVRHEYEDFLYRTPYKFGNSVVDRVTLLNVHCVIEDAAGRSSAGFGSMSMGNMWAFPSKMGYAATLGAMKDLAARIATLTNEYKEMGHPIDLNVALEPQYLKAAAELKLSDPVPKLCTLVTASPFDAAVHDAFGKLHKVNCFRTYGPGFMQHDLSHYLGSEFKGEYLERYVLRTATPSMPVFHSVGAADPIVAADITNPLNDGLPETLPDWIVRDGLLNLKIKLTGDDLQWDANRVLTIDRVTTETQGKRGVTKWSYSLDFNERCPNIDYLMGFLRMVKEKAPAGFGRIQYVEQPTKRDLKADRANVMHEAAKLLPVVIDESLTDVESLMLAREMGYSGAALKACKGQSQVLLMAAKAQKHKMYLCVQDLTCPGASLIHSATIAAHVPGVAGIEANSREYVPAANAAWEKRFPGVFTIHEGKMNTRLLDGPGLGAVA
ncbi:MAG: enolase C-terminal domain-like protein [Bryobacteraceae bacterium]